MLPIELLEGRRLLSASSVLLPNPGSPDPDGSLVGAVSSQTTRNGVAVRQQARLGIRADEVENLLNPRTLPEPDGLDALRRRRPGPVLTFTGTLQGGIFAIGGETTGFILTQDNGQVIDVFIPRQLEDEAAAADGQRVTVTGFVVTVNFVERGPTPVLVATSIAPAA